MEKQLKHILKSIEGRGIKLATLLSKIEFEQNPQKELLFQEGAMIRLYLYKVIKGFKSYKKLLVDLKENEEDTYALGFWKDENNQLILPSKRTFNLFCQEKRKDLNEIAQLILRCTAENGVVLDLKIVKKEIEKRRKKKLNERRGCEQAIKLVKKIVYPMVKIPIHHNSKFTTKDLLDVLTHVAYSHDFTNNGSNIFKELYPNKEVPSAEVMMYHFSKLDSVDEIMRVAQILFRTILKYAKKNYKILGLRKYMIAYDVHNVPYYGDKNDPYVCGSKHERGTSHFFKYLTCSVVVAGTRFCIDCVPIHSIDKIEDLLAESLSRVRRLVKIDKVLLDRGFDKVKVINVLKAFNFDFIMPKIRTPPVKEWMMKSEGCKSRCIKDFIIGDKVKAKTNLYLVDDENGVKRAFSSNLDIPEQLAHHYFRFYKARWGIETKYRQLDHDFKARTTSKDYHIRFFYFMFSILLYNLWILVNLCVSLTFFKRAPEKPLITAKMFAVILYRVKYEDLPA
jgi:hypothetical protein